MIVGYWVSYTIRRLDLSLAISGITRRTRKVSNIKAVLASPFHDPSRALLVLHPTPYGQSQVMLHVRSIRYWDPSKVCETVAWVYP